MWVSNQNLQVNFYFRRMVDVLVQMRDVDENVQHMAKRMKMHWSHLNNILNTMYLFNLVDIDRSKSYTKFTLTNDGRQVREHFWKIQEIIQRNRRDTLVRMHGYSSREELLSDVEVDLK